MHSVCSTRRGTDVNNLGTSAEIVDYAELGEGFLTTMERSDMDTRKASARRVTPEGGIKLHGFTD